MTAHPIDAPNLIVDVDEKGRLIVSVFEDGMCIFRGKVVDVGFSFHEGLTIAQWMNKAIQKRGEEVARAYVIAQKECQLG